MFTSARPFSGFAVDDISVAKEFYGEMLGMPVEEDHGMLTLQIGDGHRILAYPKEEHTPATFTILNFRVDDIDAAVEDLVGRGIVFQRYEGTDEKASVAVTARRSPGSTTLRVTSCRLSRNSP